ncbi:MAG: GTP-binding protein Der [Euryarchaeota archaeon ADurb.Bin190]|jgi:nucleolar GTP-binding protein|nr:MAG: GTP-binding protein Der [Euryarchaeota archaeon ADurb.Bin190]HNU39291.1 NOG1 family protein [Methanothrix sp.]
MFEQLPTVPTSEELLNKSFRRASRAVDDLSMVQNAGNILSDNLSNLIRKFPSFENMPPFYREMADIIAGVDRIRISLSRLGWASRQIRLITKEHVAKIKRSSPNDATLIRKSAFGRISSVMRSIEKDLLFLNETRNLLRKMPTINPSLPTILIAGYPNVGKSSFIVRITGARPEIASYPFTTRGIFVGHFMRGEQRYQVVDTPGLLDRPMEERNNIERQTIAALSHLQGVLLFILDPSEHCGYFLDSQLSLAQDIQNWISLPMLIVANKADILKYTGDRDVLEMSTETGQGVEDVLERLVGLLDKSK